MTPAKWAPTSYTLKYITYTLVFQNPPDTFSGGVKGPPFKAFLGGVKGGPLTSILSRYDWKTRHKWPEIIV